MVRSPQSPALDPELIAIAAARGLGRRRKKPRLKGSPIGDALAALRIKSGFTQVELAEASGVSLKFIRKVEQGGTSVNLEVLTRLASFLGAEVRFQERDG